MPTPQQTNNRLTKEIEMLRRRVAELEQELAQKDTTAVNPHLLPSVNQTVTSDTHVSLEEVITSINEHIYVTEYRENTWLLVYLSPQIESLTGYSLETFTGKWHLWTTLIHPDDRSLAAKQATKLASGYSSVAEYRLIRADDTIIWVRDSARSVHNGAIKQVYGVVRDITEEKQAVQQLAESEARYRSVIEVLTEGVLLVNHSGEILACNASAEKILGLPANQIIGRNVSDSEWRSIHEDGSPFPGNQYPASVTLRTGQPCENVIVGMYQADNSLLWLSVHSQPIFRADSTTPYAVVVSFHDITERKQSEEALRHSEERYRKLFEQANDAIFLSNEINDIIDANPGACTMLGYSREELLQLNLEQVYLLPPVDDTRLLDPSTIQTVDFIDKEGNVILVEISTSYVRHKSGRLALSIVRDITERQQLEEQLRQAQKMEAVGRLAGGIAHDFNNVLTIIKGYTELLLDYYYLPDDPRHEDLLQIQKASDRAGNLIRQLLLFSRREALRPEVLNLNDIVIGLGKMLHRLIGENIIIETNLANDLALVEVDPGQLEQVIMNLVVNARDAMPTSGKLTIETANIKFSKADVQQHGLKKAGNYVKLTISDTGAGMDKETQKHIFEPFFTTKNIDKGTGLGLSTVYGIVQQSNGYINVKSKVGQGSTFCILLPQTRHSSLNNSLIPAPSAAKSPYNGQETVLLVEDEPAVRSIASQFLKKLGYAVLEAAHPFEALDNFSDSATTIDLLVTDVIMPDMNGPELARQFSQKTPDLKILYISGYTDEVLRQHGFNNPGLALLEKPFSMEQLGKKIREVLS